MGEIAFDFVANSGRMTGDPEVIGSPVGFVPIKALVLAGLADFRVGNPVVSVGCAVLGGFVRGIFSCSCMARVRKSVVPNSKRRLALPANAPRKQPSKISHSGSSNATVGFSTEKRAGVHKKVSEIGDAGGGVSRLPSSCHFDCGFQLRISSLL